MEEKEIKRGEIYYCDLSPTVGSEQDGSRPVLVIQNNKGNIHSPTVIIALITSKNKKYWLPTHVFIGKDFGLEYNSTVMLEQIKTIDKSRLGEYVGAVDEKAMDRIDTAIKVSLNIERDENYG